VTPSDVQCIKNNIDKLVEIRTVSGECLVARILFVTHDEDCDEHEVLYQVVSSNQLDQYHHLETSGGYVLDFEETVSVKPADALPTNH